MVRTRHFNYRSLSRIRRAKRLSFFLEQTALALGLSIAEVAEKLRRGKSAEYLRNAKGFGICANEYGLPSNTLSSGSNQAAIYRTSCVLLRDVRALRLVFSNARLTATGEQAPPDTVTYEASIEPTPGGGGTPVRVTFNGGAFSATLAPGQSIVSDNVAIALPKGARMYVRTKVGVDALGKKWPTYLAMDSGIAEGFSASTTWLLDASIPTLSGAGGVGPSAVMSLDTEAVSYVILGSSSAAGQGDVANAPNYELGYLARALTARGLGHAKSAVASDSLQKFLGANAYRFKHLADVRAEVVIQQLGGNDISNGRTLSQIQADLRATWALLRASGVRIIQTDYTPVTSSTDNWATTANQTLPLHATVRQQVNDWLKSQASTGQFDTLVNISDLVSDVTGKWLVDGTANKFTVDGTHLSPYAHALVASAIAAKL